MHNILDEPSDPKSYSSNILLKDYLKNKEIDDIISNDEIFNKLNNKEKQKIRSYRESDKINQSLFNLKFLKEREESGDLIASIVIKGDRWGWCDKEGTLQVVKSSIVII